MATLTFAERSGINGPQLVSEIQTALSLSGLPVFAQVDKNFTVTHPSITAGNQSAIQTVITNHVANPLFGITMASRDFNTITLNGGQPLVWTNMPSALTGLAQTNCKLPLHTASYARLTVQIQVAGFAGSVLIAQFSLDGAAFTNGPQVPIGATGLQVSALGVIPDQFKTDCFFRLAGQGGNATADPQLGLVTVQFG